MIKYTVERLILEKNLREQVARRFNMSEQDLWEDTTEIELHRIERYYEKRYNGYSIALRDELC